MSAPGVILLSANKPAITKPRPTTTTSTPTIYICRTLASKSFPYEAPDSNSSLFRSSLFQFVKQYQPPIRYVTACSIGLVPLCLLNKPTASQYGIRRKKNSAAIRQANGNAALLLCSFIKMSLPPSSRNLNLCNLASDRRITDAISRKRLSCQFLLCNWPCYRNGQKSSSL